MHPVALPLRERGRCEKIFEHCEGEMSRAVSQRLPSLGTDLTTYLTEIRKFPILSQDEEATLGRRWRDRGDREAAY
ncbi:sigma-70 factor domain-containing protein, partial [Ralstonia solanacearum]|uniref:sigma-70 factor domain-containing protein n=1 Tax=Ralstonia solanacearum TaxID=305 RepID=UPI00399D630C